MVTKTEGTPVRLKGGHLTHWAGREHDGARLLAHGDYAWTSSIREPLPAAKPCPRSACGRTRGTAVTAEPGFWLAKAARSKP